MMSDMTDAQLSALLIELLALPHETEWVEFKHDYAPQGDCTVNAHPNNTLYK